jgi:hypothetical protein
MYMIFSTESGLIAARPAATNSCVGSTVAPWGRYRGQGILVGRPASRDWAVSSGGPRILGMGIHDSKG